MKKGFTLIELLISVAILGFGLVIIIQSYLNSVNGLNVSENYIEAMLFAREKFSELELEAFQNDGLIRFGADSGREFLNSREFNWMSQVAEISDPEYLADELVEVCIKLDWKERNVRKDAALAAYLPKQKLPE